MSCALFTLREKYGGKKNKKKGFLHELKKNKLNYLTKLKLLFGLLYENFKLKKRENLKKNK